MAGSRRPFAQLSRAACLAVLALLAAACVPRPRPTGFLESYNDLLPGPFSYYQVFSKGEPPAKPPRVDHVLQVMPARWDAASALSPADEKDLLSLLDLRFLIYMQRYAPPSVIVTINRDVDDMLHLGLNVTRVRVSITRVTRGVGIVRPVLGAFGIGAAEIQMEGRLEDVRTGRVLARFARRERNSGIVLGMMTPQSVSAKFCWRFGIDAVAKDLAKYVRDQLVPPKPGWQKTLMTPTAATAPTSAPATETAPQEPEEPHIVIPILPSKAAQPEATSQPAAARTPPSDRLRPGNPPGTPAPPTQPGVPPPRGAAPKITPTPRPAAPPQPTPPPVGPAQPTAPPLPRALLPR